MIKVMLIDDHQMLRDGLRLLIENEPDLRVVAEAGSGEEGLALQKTTLPDLIVLDLGMPGMSGFDFIRQLRSSEDNTPIIILSMHNDPEIVTEAIRLGADGIVPKSGAHSHLLEAIRRVYEGEQYLHPNVIQAVFDELGSRHDKALLLRKLSKRENEVMELCARGFTSRYIGQTLSLSPKTVETYRRRVMEKLRLSSRADLVHFALTSGLLDERKN